MPYSISTFITESSNHTLQNSFLACLPQPDALQAMVLQDILSRASNTEFGQQHNFSGIHTPEVYAQQVPLSTWGDHTAYCRRLEAGKENLLFPGPVLHFLQTSGTTGQNKWVPQSSTGSSLNRAVTRLRSYFRQNAIAGKQSPIGDEVKVLLLSGQSQLTTTTGGIPVGYASGVTAASAPTQLAKLQAVPAWVYSVKDTTKRDFLILRFALEEPNLVAAIGNNPRRFSALIRQASTLATSLITCIHSGSLGCPSGVEIPAVSLKPNPIRANFLANLQKQGRFLPTYYWPYFNMACFWLSGPMAPSAHELLSLIPDNTLFFDAGYGASELKINIPMVPGSPYAPLALFAGYFEFLPEDGGPPLPCWQLQDGCIYEIVLTTYSGLYRYRLGDLIRVNGFTYKTPNIAFYSRVAEAANLAGEKTPVPLLHAAAEAACHSLGGQLSTFFLWPDDIEGRYHCFYGVCEAFEKNEKEHWAAAFDQSLQGLSMGYARRRQDGSLKPPTAICIPTSWKAHRCMTNDANGQTKNLTILSSHPKLD